MRHFLLLLMLLLQPVTPTMTATWQGNTLHVAWSAPGWHTVQLDHTPLDKGYGINAGIFDMPIAGVDSLYSPKAGQVLRLIDEAGKVTLQIVVPVHLVPRVSLPIVVNLAKPPPKPMYRAWLARITR